MLTAIVVRDRRESGVLRIRFEKTSQHISSMEGRTRIVRTIEY